MKERPILMKGEGVSGILDLRKTQTRRVINRLLGFGMITEFGESDTSGYIWQFRDKQMRWHDIDQKRLIECCPYGQEGDRLWLRETWGTHDNYAKVGIAFYKATDGQNSTWGGKWRPSIFMPHWASRILLENIADPVPQRLQEISEEDAIAEGITMNNTPWEGWYWLKDVYSTDSPQMAFKKLWDSINGEARYGYRVDPETGKRYRYEKPNYSWESDPWVWKIEFKVVT